jgi:hypothetical protein
MLDDSGKWWARREVKLGKPTPADFRPVETDDYTGKTMGWVPIEGVQFAKYHAEALEFNGHLIDGPGTYELIGLRINGNPEGISDHKLVKHANAQTIEIVDRSFSVIRSCWSATGGGAGKASCSTTQTDAWRRSSTRTCDQPIRP